MRKKAAEICEKALPIAMAQKILQQLS